MNVLVIADRLSARGGADQHLLAVLRELLRRRAQLCLLVGRSDGSAVAPCGVVEIAGIDARHACLPVVQKSWQDAIETACERFRPDVVHVHNVVNPALLEWAAARGAVMTVQDHRFFCPGRGKLKADESRCEQRFDKATCRECFGEQSYFEQMLALTTRRLRALAQMRRVIVLSRYMKRQLSESGVSAERIDVIAPFVDDLDYRAAAKEPCVLFVGRLVSAKGAHDAALAWRDSGTDLPLVFAGTGRQRAELEQLGHRVLGWTDRGTLSSLYRGARAVLFPSRWQEPYGIVGLEALSFGTPVAAWESGGVAEWHPGGALLARWGDRADLTRALVAALELPDADRRPKLISDRRARMRQLLNCYGFRGK
jgi:glycosyltransferase involved in cell wall biosynthesis